MKKIYETFIAFLVRSTIETKYGKLRDLAPSVNRAMGCIAQLRYMDCLQIMRKWIHIVFISLSEGPSLIYAGELFTDIELDLLLGVMNFLFFKDILKI